MYASKTCMKSNNSLMMMRYSPCLSYKSLSMCFLACKWPCMTGCNDFTSRLFFAVFNRMCFRENILFSHQQYEVTRELRRFRMWAHISKGMVFLTAFSGNLRFMLHLCLNRSEATCNLFGYPVHPTNTQI